MKFPIECGPPRKLIKNIKEYLNYVNLYNGKRKAVYKSVYSFEETKINDYRREVPDYSSAIVDCIFFDFDFKSCEAFIEVKKLHEYCMKENLKHTIIFSGRGYHLYIYCKIYNLQYKKETIRGAQQYFIDKLKLTVDRQVIGNVAQLARIPNTYHPKAGRFCIPLTKEQFEKGDEFIKTLAEKQNFVKNVIIGSKLFDISIWDIEPDNSWLDFPQINLKSFNKPVLTKEIPPCISNILKKSEKRWKDRYIIILYFKQIISS